MRAFQFAVAGVASAVLVDCAIEPAPALIALLFSPPSL